MIVGEQEQVELTATLAHLTRSTLGTRMGRAISTTTTIPPHHTIITIRITKIVEGDRTIIDIMMDHPHAMAIIFKINIRIIIALVVVATEIGTPLQDHTIDTVRTSTTPIPMITIETTGTIINPITTSGDTRTALETKEGEGVSEGERTTVIDVSVIITNILQQEQQQEQEGLWIILTRIEIANRTETTLTAGVLVRQDNTTTATSIEDRRVEKKDTIIKQ